MADHSVVIALEDGTRVQGLIKTFDPRRTMLTVRRTDAMGVLDDMVDIPMRDVDAVFFVRDLAKGREHRRSDDPATASPAAARSEGIPIQVHVRWGEVVEGVLRPIKGDQKGLFLVPAGSSSRAGNSAGVWIRRTAIKSIKRAPEAGA